MATQPYLNAESPHVQHDSIFAVPPRKKPASEHLDDDSTESYLHRGAWLVPTAVQAENRVERPSERGETPEPAVLGNTALSTRQPRYTPWNAAGGFDWIEATFKAIPTFKYAETEKILTQKTLEANALQEGVPILIFGAAVVVEPMYKPKVWGRTSFRWKVTFNGCTMFLARGDQPESCESGKIEWGSLPLTQHGHRECWEHSKRVLEEMGLEYQSSKLYRADVCGDVVGVHCSVYCEALAGDKVVSRFRGQTSTHKTAEGKWTGFNLGSRDRVYLRVYDKLQELKDTKDRHMADAKRYALVERRWGIDPDDVTRFEYEFRGTWLRALWPDLESVEDLFDNVGRVTTYLTEKFFRIVEGIVDRENRNQSRLEFHPCWTKAIEAFCDWAGRVVAETIKEALSKMTPEEVRDWHEQRGHVKPPDVERISRMIAGLSTTLLAVTPGNLSKREFYLGLLGAVERSLGEGWRENAERKRVRMFKTGMLDVYGHGAFGYRFTTYSLGTATTDEELSEIVDQVVQQSLPF